MINHMGKFDDASDMIFHLQGLQKTWNEQEWGKVDFDLMEVVEGLEIAASAWFNGQDYLRNEKGLVCGYLDAEEKKEGDGGTGETTGEMGTTFIGTDESNPIFKEILCKPAIIEKLRAMKYKGAFDINCIKTEKGLVALEPTMRFGIPSTPYEMEESLENPAEVIEACARGNQPHRAESVARSKTGNALRHARRDSHASRSAGGIQHATRIGHLHQRAAGHLNKRKCRNRAR